ncbi:FRG domain-containing protein [Amphritea atlantica]|uniref:FRG domain-containing protein n=1 Tax=Amphritea atlantica TaxID=355243 RepID=A0ABY5GXN6_9GAMM|nr:FRG domain-containing protein [Amphritea atlantica]
MEGQWVGVIQGDNSGGLIINIDCIDGKYQGYFLLWEETNEIVSVSADITVVRNENRVSFTGSNIQGIDKYTGQQLSYMQLEKKFPECILPASINVTADFGDNGYLKGHYKTSIGNSGIVTLCGPNFAPSIIKVEETSWKKFKEKAWEFKDNSYLYRGQRDNTWRLRTTFHRRGRADLRRYFREDLPRLYRKVHAQTGIKFDLKCNQDIGSLLYLAQHHGFPTPLLDWSESPFVAAYFAFNEYKELKANKGQLVRIYIFDKEAWCRDSIQVESFDSNLPTITYNELLASGNPRATPQQAVTTLSNIDYIEAHIHQHSVKTGIQYLTAYDLPADEFETVLAELRLMGISASSLFPDLDGICRDLKEQYF